MATRSANGCRLHRAASSNALELDFEYLGRNDGAVFEVEHTGPTWKANASGTLKGTQKTLVERMPTAYYSNERWWIYLVLLATPVALGIAAATSRHPKGDWVATAAVAGVLFAVGAIFWFTRWEPAPPRGLWRGRDSKLVDQRFDSSGHPLSK